MSIKKEIKEIEKVIDDIEKDVKKDIKYAERWMYERKKFFVKLAWVVGLITLLIILSNIYLRVKGFG